MHRHPRHVLTVHHDDRAVLIIVFRDHVLQIARRRCMSVTADEPADGSDWLMEVRVADNKFLTIEEVCERYRREISTGTLRNWRAQRIGPPFVKIGKSVLYPVQALDEWDKKNLVTCRASRKLVGTDSDPQ